MAVEAERLLKGAGWLPEVLRRADLVALQGEKSDGQGDEREGLRRRQRACPRRHGRPSGFPRRRFARRSGTDDRRRVTYAPEGGETRPRFTQNTTISTI